AEPLLGAAGALAAGAAPEAGLAERAAKAAELAGQTPARLLERFDSELLPRIEAASQRAETAVREASAALALASAELPKAEALLAEAERGVAFGKSKLGELSAELPAAERGIARLAAKLRELREQGSLEDAIRLLRSDYARKAAFLAKPVEIKTERLYPIATYGAAMTPFFTVLSIWVGALLLVSMLSTDVHLEPGEPAPGARSAYVGRLLTFAAVGLLQTLLAALGDLLLLGVDAASPLLFVLGSLGISLVFMTIVYTLVSLLGNVGKAAAIVLLVLQLAASGGTFPIQLTHPVFQAVYPFLPFTYASRLLREAVGGILPEAALRDALLLLAFGLAALAAGLLLKRRLNGIAARLAAKARESRIIH
ncbi:YhgE/Pip family protein, partial [Paenibacillus pasadenensis]